MSNVLLIGGGGREHALAWALKKSPRVGKLFVAPGNAGIASLTECIALDFSDHAAVLDFIEKNKIDFTMIGPEAPLVEGLADALRAKGKNVFGPGRAAAQLEGSKLFAKNFMRSHSLPTADFVSFSKADEALAFVKSGQWKESLRVVKASGLAAGKGVTVCRDRNEVLKALEEAMVQRTFGAAGDQVIIEEILPGEELSVIALCDGKTILPLSPSQDHKRVFDNDQGPNTGGMGAYAPAPQATETLWRQIDDIVFKPFLKGLARDKLDFRGVIYFGLMLAPGGAKVLEFNVRFGDPETQVVVPLVENDWLDLLEAAAERRLDQVNLRKAAGAAVTVVLAAKGYPGNYPKGQRITGLETLAGQKDVLVFHAGTARQGDGFVTNGGRVLAVTGLGPDLPSARDRAYAAARQIQFEGAHFRTDIASRALKHLSATTAR